MTLLCEFDSNPIVAAFTIESQTDSFCKLDGACDSTACSGYNATCSSGTQYSIHVNVPQTWNGMSLFCQNLLGQRSNNISFRVTGTVNGNYYYRSLKLHLAYCHIVNFEFTGWV